MKMNHLLRASLFISLLALSALLPGCAHSDLDHKIDAEIAKETVSNSAELGTEAREIIQSSKTLTAEQKTKLLALQAETQTQLKELSQRSIRLRSLLIKNVAQNDSDPTELALTKKKLQENEKQKLTVLFSALDHANFIIGKHSDEGDAIMNSLADAHHQKN